MTQTHRLAIETRGMDAPPPHGKRIKLTIRRLPVAPIVDPRADCLTVYGDTVEDALATSRWQVLTADEMLREFGSVEPERRQVLALLGKGPATP